LSVSKQSISALRRGSAAATVRASLWLILGRVAHANEHACVSAPPTTRGTEGDHRLSSV
jgi:hypothetical protein